MSDHVLCNGDVQVDLAPASDGLLLNLSVDGQPFVSYNIIEIFVLGLLGGDTVQVSGNGAYCRFEPDGDSISINYSAAGQFFSCQLSRGALEAAVRGMHPAHDC